MPKMTSCQMSYILDIDIQRSKSPLIRWIEQKVYSGSGTNYGTFYPEVLESIIIRRADHKATSGICYDVNPLNNSLCVTLPHDILAYIIDTSRPKFNELETIKMVLPNMYKYLQTLCEAVKLCLDRPHSCEIEYYTRKDFCSGSGCSRYGEVNHNAGCGNWKFYCAIHQGFAIK